MSRFSEDDHPGVLRRTMRQLWPDVTDEEIAQVEAKAKQIIAAHPRGPESIIIEEIGAFGEEIMRGRETRRT